MRCKNRMVAETEFMRTGKHMRPGDADAGQGKEARAC
jgi:hypothetical protein